ncbi:MAG: 2-hydroxychromene-2-carboxylate isomerase [Pseudomonadota bacterium]
MTAEITVYCALQSPWTYLGWQRFLDLAKARGAKPVFRPIKMAPVFDASGGLPLAKRPKQRQAYRMMELKRWRDVLNVPLTLEPAFFPVDETLAARMVIALDEQGGDVPVSRREAPKIQDGGPDLRRDAAAGGDAGELSLAILRAVWAEERNIADRATLLAIATEQGLDGEALIAAADSQATDDIYDAHTEAALKDGVFGVPTFKLGDELFWGQDRLDLLARALG